MSSSKARADAAWRAFIEFVHNPEGRSCTEPWDTPTVPKTKPKTRRRRHITLERAMKEAEKAGIKPTSAKVTADGVQFDLTEHAANDDSQNEWDDKLKVRK
jgi:hypothetical protein